MAPPHGASSANAAASVHRPVPSSQMPSPGIASGVLAVLSTVNVVAGAAAATPRIPTTTAAAARRRHTSI
jgi:hypothetical protein